MTKHADPEPKHPKRDPKGHTPDDPAIPPPHAQPGITSTTPPPTVFAQNVLPDQSSPRAVVVTDAAGSPIRTDRIPQPSAQTPAPPNPATGEVWTKIYDCGCSLSGGKDLPDYCPQHTEALKKDQKKDSKK
jgi:hypothetical protein